MAFNFVTEAIDGLLEGNKSSVICYDNGGFNHKKIEEVAFKKYQINAELLKLGMEFGCNI
jgi:6-phosphofructokinase 1